MPGVANGYTASYLGALEGFKQAQAAVKKDPTVAPNISGIETPDDHDDRLQAHPAESAVVIQTLSLPVVGPGSRGVREEVSTPRTPPPTGRTGVHGSVHGSERLRQHVRQGREPELHGQAHRLHAGQGDRPGSEPELGPEHRFPAGLCGLDHDPGGIRGHRLGVGKKILSGSDQLNGDFVPSKTIIQEIASGSKYSRISCRSSPSGGNRYVALNTSEPPFDDVNVRKAVVAGPDREALRNTRGGALVGARWRRTSSRRDSRVRGGRRLGPAGPEPGSARLPREPERAT